jgi:hypothetical protein
MSKVEDMSVEQYNYRQVDYMREWASKIRAFSRRMIIYNLQKNERIFDKMKKEGGYKGDL